MNKLLIFWIIVIVLITILSIIIYKSMKPKSEVIDGITITPPTQNELKSAKLEVAKIILKK